tara:strand:- start:3523 stop:4437 length:915 start_codon:yes stop_codon:yes gene_type:complete
MGNRGSHYAPRHRRKPVIRKEETITLSDFDGESRRHGRIVVARAKSLGKAVENWLKAEARKQVTRVVNEIRQYGPRAVMRTKKAMEDWDDEKLLRILALYGVRQIEDSGLEIAGSSWVFKPTVKAEYLLERQIMIQGLKKSLEKEMRGAVGTALGTWFIEEPGLTVGQISQRLRTWLTVSTSKDTPLALKPLGRRFTAEGLGARARMIARTETNRARNFGRIEAGKVMGAEYFIWLAETDGLSGDRQHDALNRQVRPVGENFVNPATGASLAYPGDGDAEEVINCRCSVRPLTADQARQFGYGD